MIGVFDSGLGGLTGLREIARLIPNEHFVYFGDTGRVPYGTRSAETIMKYSRQAMRFFESRGVDSLLIACGTVSSIALETLRQESNIPLTGVIEPACEEAFRLTSSGRIGVIGTAATIRSGSFYRCLKRLKPSLEVITKACPLFVPMVEYGFTSPSDPIARDACEFYLSEFRENGVDTLILGCTHYPIIAEAIARTLPEIRLVNPGEMAARSIYEKLTAAGRLPTGTQGQIDFYVSDDPEDFERQAEIFLGSGIEIHASKISIDSL